MKKSKRSKLGFVSRKRTIKEATSKSPRTWKF